MGHHQCIICNSRFEDADRLVPLLMGYHNLLICQDCLKGGRLPDSASGWNRLQRRHQLVEMGWRMGETGDLFDDMDAVPAVSLEEVPIDPEAFRLVSADFAMQHRLIPIMRMGSELVVAMADPGDEGAMEELHMMTGMDVQVAYAPEEEVLSAIHRHYGPPDRCPLHGADEIDIFPLLPDVKDPTILNLVNLILSELIRSPATEVHVERNEQRVQVLYRIDGLLNQAMQPPKHLGHRLIACFRLLGKLHQPEPLAAQRATVELITRQNRKVRLALSFEPHASGENVIVTRIGK